jgi:hypothetical protein
VSTGERVAAQYRGVATDQLRHLRGLMRNQRRQAAVDIVLTERQESYQVGFDAAQVILDAVGGEAADVLHAKALDAAMRHADAKRFLEAEQAYGVANALWDCIRERSDT